MATSKDTAARQLFGVIASAMLVLTAAPISADECAHFTSADALPQGELRLCEHVIDGVPTTFACRSYRDADFRYELLFKGGPTPKAIYQQAIEGGKARWLPVSLGEVPPRACRQTPPTGVPASAAYRGTGVCQDASDNALPCSVYEHAAAREPDELRYFVYYAPDGTGVRNVDVIVAGRNERVIEAELAFQMGIQLLDSSCCRDQAQAYLAHAHGIFPDDHTYRVAYQDSLDKRPATSVSEAVQAPYYSTKN